MTKYWLFLFFLSSLSANASTFVGNGGNAGDLDLAITLAQIHDTFKELDEESAGLLCRCPDEFAENGVCRILRALNTKQVKVCDAMLIKNSEALVSLSSKNSKVKFTWSDKPFTVISDDGSKRIVDAVAQNENFEITINRPRFLELPQSFRIALITHELFHLVSIGGNYITDDKAIEPFKDGKSLLDTLGAATAMAANEMKVISDFSHLQNVSRAYKKFIFQLDIKSIYHTEKAARKLLKDKLSHATSFNFEYKPESFGYRLGIEGIDNSSKYLDTISVDETMTLFNLGIGYHWFPVTTRLSRWSELHLSGFVDLLHGVAQYKVQDEAMTLDDKGQVSGVQAAGQIHVPIVYGWWGNIGYQVRDIRYQYKDLGISIKEFQQIFFLGGAYAI